MHIAYIAPYQGPGLLETRPTLLNLGLAANVKMELVAELLRSSGHTTEILSQGEVVERRWKFYPAFGEPRPAHPGARVFYASALPWKFINVLWSTFWTYRLFKRQHRLAPYDLVILYNLKLPQVICGLYAMYRGLPVVLEYEDDALVDLAGKTEGGLVDKVYLRLARKALKSVSGCIGVSPHILTRVPETVPKILLRGVVTENIMKLGAEKTAARKKWAVFSGTFSRAKGLEPLVKAWQMAKLPDWELHIAGHGEKSDLLTKMAEGNSSIVFHGLLNREENARLLGMATIGMNPHDVSETPGNVFAFKIIECLAAGTHVITTPMGPLEKELEAGITYIPDNSPETIAAALQHVIEEREYERTAMEAAQELYGPAAVARSLDELLSRVTPKSGKPSEPIMVSSRQTTLDPYEGGSSPQSLR
jgi:glycosyltransferase involved in cell wall biosynthesis